MPAPWPLRFGAFFAPFHPVGQSPTLALEYDLERAVELDRLGYDEAWFGEHHSGGYELIGCPEIFIAAAAERTQAHQARHRRRVAAVPPPVAGGRPAGAARPPDAGPDDLRRGPGRAADRRLHHGHRPGRAAPHDGGVARGDPRPVPQRGAGHPRDRLVHDARGAPADPALHLPALRGRGRGDGVAVGAAAGRTATASSLLSLSMSVAEGFAAIGRRWDVVDEKAAASRATAARPADLAGARHDAPRRDPDQAIEDCTHGLQDFANYFGGGAGFVPLAPTVDGASHRTASSSRPTPRPATSSSARPTTRSPTSRTCSSSRAGSARS